MQDTISIVDYEIANDINIKVNTIKLEVHTFCYCVLDLLCVRNALVKVRVDYPPELNMCQQITEHINLAL